VIRSFAFKKQIVVRQYFNDTLPDSLDTAFLSLLSFLLFSINIFDE
jgi:hypothetical protein